MNFKEFQKIVKFARKEGVLKVKTRTFEIEMAQFSLLPTTKTSKISQSPTVQEDVASRYTPEQIMYWSSQPIDPGGENA